MELVTSLASGSNNIGVPTKPESVGMPVILRSNVVVASPGGLPACTLLGLYVAHAEFLDLQTSLLWKTAGGAHNTTEDKLLLKWNHHQEQWECHRYTPSEALNTSSSVSPGSCSEAPPPLPPSEWQRLLMASRDCVEQNVEILLVQSHQLHEMRRQWMSPFPHHQQQRPTNRWWTQQQHKVISQLLANMSTISTSVESNNNNVTTPNSPSNVVAVLRTTRDVPEGEILRVWMEPRLACLWGVPSLMPRNFTDSRRYTCHLCPSEFPFPNQLKTHLFLHEKGRIPSMSATMTPGKRTNPEATTTTSAPLPPHLRPYMFQESLSAMATAALQHLNPLGLGPHFPSRSSHSFWNPPTPAPSLSLPSLLMQMQQNAIFSPPRAVPAEAPHRKSSTVPISGVSPMSSRRTWTNRNPVAPKPGTAKGHLCMYCGKHYSRKYGLKIHLRTHTGYKPLKCKVCGRPFGDPSNLNKHVRLHSSNSGAPYKCHLCEKVLVRRRDLERHLYSRHATSTGPTPCGTSSQTTDLPFMSAALQTALSTSRSLSLASTSSASNSPRDEISNHRFNVWSVAQGENSHYNHNIIQEEKDELMQRMDNDPEEDDEEDEEEQNDEEEDDDAASLLSSTCSSTTQGGMS